MVAGCCTGCGCLDIPVSSRPSSGEYGYSDIFIGVPAVLGAHGIEKVIEMELTEEERTLFNRTAEHVKELVEKL